MKSKKIIALAFAIAIFFLSMHMFIDCIKLMASDYDVSKTYVYEMDVDSPLSIEELVSEIGLEAIYDEEYINDYIVLVEDSSYIKDVLNKGSSFMRRLGEYTLIFKVTNQFGQSSQCEIIVDVKDMTAPVLIEEYSKLEYTFYKSDLISEKAYNIIKNSILAFDNCERFNVRKELEEKDWNEVVGGNEYSINLCLYDSYDNENDVEIIIDVIDDTLIRFEMDSPYSIVSSADKISPISLITSQNISAFDSKNNKLNISLDGKYAEYLTHTGINVISFKAEDQNGNSSIIQHLVYVIDSNEPYFTLDESKLVVYSNELFTVEKLENLIKMRASKNKKYVYDLVNDQYTKNYKEEGLYDYEVELSYLNEDGSLSGEKERISFVLEVIEMEDVKEDGFKNIGSFTISIKKIGQILYGIIKWPIVFLGTYLK